MDYGGQMVLKFKNSGIAFEVMIKIFFLLITAKRKKTKEKWIESFD